MSSERRWRLGVIGCGEWGPNHVRNFGSLAGAAVVAVADPRADRLARIARQYPAIERLSTAADLLARPDIDAVVIATPTATHHGLVREALGAGKHVLCEKPLCTSVAEGEELVRLAAARRLVLMVGHVFLFNPGIQKLKAVLDAGELGRIFYLSSRRTNLGPVRADVGAFFDLASHDVSIFNFLLGSCPEEVSAVGRAFLQRGREDIGFAVLHYPAGVVAAVHVSWLDPKKVRELTVVGDRRMAIWDDLSPLGPVMVLDKGIMASRDYSDYGEFQLLAREGDVTVPRVTPEEPLRLQARHFLQALDRGRADVADGRQGIEVIKVLAALDRSMAGGGAPVKVDP